MYVIGSNLSTLHVTGETSHFMHLVDITDPSNPVYLFSHEFTRGEGIPQSIDICGSEIAVGLAAQTDINEGHVRFYHTYTRGSGETDVYLDGYVTGTYSLFSKCSKFSPLLVSISIICT